MNKKMRCNSVLNDKDSNGDQDYALEWITGYQKKLQPRLQPGLYMIICLVNDYRYYGETSNVSSRLAGHKRDLRRKIHQSSTLQADFNLFTEENFEFSVLFIGDDWKDRDRRLEKETQLILDHPGQCYNSYPSMTNRVNELNSFYGKRHSEKTKRLIGDLQKGIPKDQLGVRLSIEGKVYPSLAEASRRLKHARKTIRNHLDSSDPRYANWFRLSENA